MIITRQSAISWLFDRIVARGRTSQCAHFNAAAQRRYSSVTVSSCAQKNRLNVNPEIPVRREESEESVYHTDGGWLGGWVAGRLQLAENSRKNCTCMFIRMLTMCSING